MGTFSRLRESGQTSVEYLGICAVVVAVLVGLVSSPLPRMATDAVSARVCQAAIEQDCDGAAADAEEEQRALRIVTGEPTEAVVPVAQVHAIPPIVILVIRHLIIRLIRNILDVLSECATYATCDPTVVFGDDVPTETPDSDGDGVPDLLDPDTGPGVPGDADGDGIPDGIDATPGLPVYPWEDLDGNGVPDANETPFTNPGTEPTPDQDGDGVPDLVDPDTQPGGPGDQDGDGVPDGIDPDTQPADPLDCCSGDSDGDYDPPGTDNTDTTPDGDGDGVPDGIDPDTQPGGPGDQDGDGVPDGIDNDTQPSDPFDCCSGDDSDSDDSDSDDSDSDDSDSDDSDSDDDDSDDDDSDDGTTSNPHP